MAVIMLVVGVYVLMGASEYARKGVKTEAEITSIVIGNSSNGETSYKVNVEFWVDGTKYGGELDTYDASMRTGGKTTVYYMPDDPSKFHSARFNYLPGIACIVAAAIMAILFFVPHIAVRVKEAKIDRYTEEGTHIVARIMQVNRKNTRLYNKTIAVVECMGSDRNEYSQKVLLDIGDEYVVGDDIDVYVSAKTPRSTLWTPKDTLKIAPRNLRTRRRIKQTDICKSQSSNLKNLARTNTFFLTCARQLTGRTAIFPIPCR